MSGTGRHRGFHLYGTKQTMPLSLTLVIHRPSIHDKHWECAADDVFLFRQGGRSPLVAVFPAGTVAGCGGGGAVGRRARGGPGGGDGLGRSQGGGIGAVMKAVQKYYKRELGKTFRLNNPVVEVVDGEHDRQWYESAGDAGPLDKVTSNMAEELSRRSGLRYDSPGIFVSECSADGPEDSGSTLGGWVALTGHDVDGAAGRNGDMNRWYGGMVHELGHAFGLPDASYDDGTPMSKGYDLYPNTHFDQQQKDGILNGPHADLLS
jgi:hypothetical protein